MTRDEYRAEVETLHAIAACIGGLVVDVQAMTDPQREMNLGECREALRRIGGALWVMWEGVQHRLPDVEIEPRDDEQDAADDAVEDFEAARCTCCLKRIEDGQEC